MAFLTTLLNTLQVGRGTMPGFRPRRAFAMGMNLVEAFAHPTGRDTY